MKRKYAGNKKIKGKERKERRNVRGNNEIDICGENDTKHSKFISKSEIHSKYLKTSAPSSQKQSTFPLPRPTEGKFTILLRIISSAKKKKGRAVLFEVLIVLFIAIRVF